MSLYPCPECGHQVSDGAKSCPSCGWVVDRYLLAAAGRSTLPRSSVSPTRWLATLWEVRRILLFLGIAAVVLWAASFGLATCGGQEASDRRVAGQQQQRSVTLYSCDNTQVLGGRPCFPPGDPKRMTIGLYDQPAGTAIVRLRETGEGLPATVKSSRYEIGYRWYQVQCQGHTGWINEAFVK